MPVDFEGPLKHRRMSREMEGEALEFKEKTGLVVKPQDSPAEVRIEAMSIGGPSMLS